MRLRLRLNRNQLVKISRFSSSENFVCTILLYICIRDTSLYSIRSLIFSQERFEKKSGMRELGGVNNSTSKSSGFGEVCLAETESILITDSIGSIELQELSLE